jgi:Raf kinase inhibitor-like YbhB/YbcL family protein
MSALPHLLVVTSTTFSDGQAIPAKYTADGDDVSPPLAWDHVPEGTRSLALVCEDPDAPRGTWTHWVLFNLPPDTTKLDENVAKTATLPKGAVQGANDFGKTGYGGPSPPPGKPHRYFFKLYALDAPLKLQAGAGRQQLLAALEGHVLDEALLMGTYGRTKR